MKDYKYEEYEDEYDVYNQDDDDDSLFIGTLATISRWFIRIGIVIAIILFIYYIMIGKVSSAFLFVLGLVVAFFFGYGFMFLLDHIVDSN
jgi:ABC-type multidrug transport system fused ATPase/permease subunit